MPFCAIYNKVYQYDAELFVRDCFGTLCISRKDKEGSLGTNTLYFLF